MNNWPDPRIQDTPISRWEIGIAIAFVILPFLGWLF